MKDGNKVRLVSNIVSGIDPVKNWYSKLNLGLCHFFTKTTTDPPSTLYYLDRTPHLNYNCSLNLLLSHSITSSTC